MESEQYTLKKLKENDPTLIKLIWSSLNPKLSNRDATILSEVLLLNTNLVYLSLNNNNIGPLGAKSLAGIKSLRFLFIGNNKIGNEGAKILAQTTQLISLSIFGNSIDHDGTIEFTKNTSLTYLDICSNNISDFGAKMLSMMKNVVVLYLRNNNIGDSGAEDLARNPNIKELDISRNKLTDKGIISLANMKEIISLKVKSNFISDKSAPVIAEHKKLSSFEMSPEHLNPVWVKQIEKHIQTNKERAIACRDSFVQTVVLLARDKFKTDSLITEDNKFNNFGISQLPLELLLFILSFMDFVAMEKTQEQGYSCAKFIFEHIDDLNNLISNKQGLKIIESTDRLITSQRYRFFCETFPVDKTSMVSNSLNIAVERMQKKMKM